MADDLDRRRLSQQLPELQQIYNQKTVSAMRQNILAAAKTLTTSVLPQVIQDPTAMISGVCPVADENSFANVGNGGTPNTIEDSTNLNTVWMDLRPIKQETYTQASSPKVSREISEADRFVTDDSGEIYLIANQRLNSDRWSQSDCKRGR